MPCEHCGKESSEVIMHPDEQGMDYELYGGIFAEKKDMTLHDVCRPCAQDFVDGKFEILCGSKLSEWRRIVYRVGRSVYTHQFDVLHRDFH